MKRVICDQCRVETEPDQHGFAPYGSDWLSVTNRKDYKSQDFCSPKCALVALQAQSAPPVTEVERTIEEAERSVRVGEALDALDASRADDMARMPVMGSAFLPGSSGSGF